MVFVVLVLLLGVRARVYRCPHGGRGDGVNAGTDAFALLAARRRCAIPNGALASVLGGDCESVKSYGAELSNDGTEVLWERIGRVLAWTAAG